MTQPKGLTPGLDETRGQVGCPSTPPVEPGPVLGPARLPIAQTDVRDLSGHGLTLSVWGDGLVTVFAVDADGGEKPIARYTHVDVKRIQLVRLGV